MITVGEASARILARIEPLSGEAVATGNTAGRVLSERVVAPLTSPPWDNSSMDGYAVNSGDLSAGVTLRVVETIHAGSFPSRSLERGEAMRIMTGAPLPQGADSVIRHEDTDDGREVVAVRELRDAGRNIRKAGEDFRKGDVLFERGELVGVPHIGVLASAGIKTVSVHRRPRIAIISSGDELVELDDFQPDVAGSRIVSSNSLTLPASVRDAGGDPRALGIASDSPVSLKQKFESARGSDLIITSAGISVGDHDHVRTAITDLDGSIDFWKVRMRPGAPLAFGSIDGVPWIGLSGNPVSAIVTFELFVRPVIRRMLGMRKLFRATIPVRTRQPITLAASLMHFLRVVITPGPDGHHDAELAGSQSSAVLTVLARANALLILPGDRLDIAAGELHRALPLGAGFEESESLQLA